MHLVGKISEYNIYKHICTNNILVKEQYGFRINSYTKIASYNVINEILKAMNNRPSVEGIFHDLKKAFDCVNHGILVDKLEFYGISGKFLTLIQSYLRGRYQKILTDNINAYDSVSSRWEKVTNEVPQGSILGPLLFLIFINDLQPFTCRRNNPVLAVCSVWNITQGLETESSQVSYVIFRTIYNWLTFLKTCKFYMEY